MVAYQQFGRFYDAVMGNRTKTAAYVRSLIAHHHPTAKSLLELACGTGAILQSLTAAYDVAGLDVSPTMLARARKKLPRVSFFQADMRTFALGRQFDVILCLFDSLNHVLRFADWKRIFYRVAQHLAADGLFLFDVNPEQKLHRLIHAPAWVKEFDGHMLIMDVTDGGGGIAQWRIKVFAPQRKEVYRLFEETINERSFPLARIRAALREQFSVITVLDPAARRPSEKSDRVYFVCKR
jgi:trans-aconitate methyltransferase